MRATAAGLFAIVLLADCEKRTLGPSPLPATKTDGPASPADPQPGARPWQTYTVSGVVRTSGNVPVPRVRVVALGQDPPVATFTDGNGVYRLAGVTASSDFGLSPLLSASTPGYFTDVEFARHDYRPITEDTQLDFELDPWVKIALGTVVLGHGAIGNPSCSHWGYGASACQRYALTVAFSGTLDVIVSASIFTFDVDIVKPDGTFAAYSSEWVSPVHIAIPVEANSTYELRVVGGWDPAREFALTTALR